MKQILTIAIAVSLLSIGQLFGQEIKSEALSQLLAQDQGELTYVDYAEAVSERLKALGGSFEPLEQVLSVARVEGLSAEALYDSLFKTAKPPLANGERLFTSETDTATAVEVVRLFVERLFASPDRLGANLSETNPAFTNVSGHLQLQGQRKIRISLCLRRPISTF